MTPVSHVNSGTLGGDREFAVSKPNIPPPSGCYQQQGGVIIPLPKLQGGSPHIPHGVKGNQEQPKRDQPRVAVLWSLCKWNGEQRPVLYQFWAWAFPSDTFNLENPVAATNPSPGCRTYYS
ncbi:hypothetical protein BTVI_79403 [Pitangus sulphuratus]|nr:hypothetical protein BTVI_79403 [Pitangus sulphuratus]